MVFALVCTIIVVFFLISIILIPRKMGEKLAHPGSRDPEVCFQEKVNQGVIDADQYEKAQKENFTYKSANGYELKGTYILRKKEFENLENHKVVILVHGFTSNHFDMLPYYNMFYQNGFDCVIYDHRNHGYSENNYTTMGLEEAKDLEGIYQMVKSKFGDSSQIGLLGESMGAATVMIASSHLKDLAFAIEDCGYSSAWDEMLFVGKHNYHLFKIPYGDLTRKYLLKHYGYDLKEIVPVKSLAKCPEALPFLFIHGDSDFFVPSKMLKINYDAKPGNKEMKYFKGSAHARSYREHVKDYEKLVNEFLEKNKIIKR